MSCARALLIVAAMALGCAPTLAEPALIEDACSYKGPGFVQVPGTATCVKIAARSEAQAEAGTRGTRTRTGGTLSMDARTDTAMGPIRAFVRLRIGEADPRDR
jgi:hypothetical protein